MTTLLEEKKVKVLVADDDATFCEVMKAVLNLKNYVADVQTAQRGLQALSLCLDLRPDVVFIDSMMPAMDGNVLGAKVRDLLPEAHLVSISGRVAKEKPDWADIHIFKSGALFDNLDGTLFGTSEEDAASS